MDVRLSDDNMKDIIAKAILDTMTPENRSDLIANAVKSLLKANATGYGSAQTTPLQQAFDFAVREVAQTIAREQITENTEVRAAIKQMIADAWIQMAAPENYSKVVSNIATAIESGLTGGRY